MYVSGIMVEASAIKLYVFDKGSVDCVGLVTHEEV